MGIQAATCITSKHSPDGVSTHVPELIVALIVVVVDGSVGIGVVSRKKVAERTGWDSQGPQN